MRPKDGRKRKNDRQEGNERGTLMLVWKIKRLTGGGRTERCKRCMTACMLAK